MFSRRIVPALLALAMLSAPVLAAGTTSTTMQNDKAMKAAAGHDKCATLERQFDAAIKVHAKSPKAEAAKAMRHEGGGLCAAGQADEGATKLQGALKEIGVKPKG